MKYSVKKLVISAFYERAFSIANKLTLPKGLKQQLQQAEEVLDFTKLPKVIMDDGTTIVYTDDTHIHFEVDENKYFAILDVVKNHEAVLVNAGNLVISIGTMYFQMRETIAGLFVGSAKMLEGPFKALVNDLKKVEQIKPTWTSNEVAGTVEQPVAVH